MPELLRQLLHRKLFQPIRVVMRNGERYDSLDPDRIAITRTKAIAFLARMTEMPENDIELIYVPRCTRH